MCFSFSVICTYCTSDAVAEGSKKSSCMIRKPALSITKQEYDLVSLHFGYTSVSNLYLMRYKYSEIHYEDTCYEILLGNVWRQCLFHSWDSMFSLLRSCCLQQFYILKISRKVFKFACLQFTAVFSLLDYVPCLRFTSNFGIFSVLPCLCFVVSFTL